MHPGWNYGVSIEEQPHIEKPFKIPHQPDLNQFPGNLSVVENQERAVRYFLCVQVLWQHV